MGYDPKYARPDWMIWTVMPIPPPTMRPTIKLDNGQSSEDDLTSILNGIIKTNNGLQKSLQRSSKDNVSTNARDVNNKMNLQ